MGIFKRSSHSAPVSHIKEQLDAAYHYAEIINNSVSPEIFFNTFNLLIKTLNELSVWEGRINFTGELPSQTLKGILDDKETIINSFIDRAYCYALSIAKSKPSRNEETYILSDFFLKMRDYFPQMLPNNISYFKALKSEHFQNINNTNDSINYPHHNGNIPPEEDFRFSQEETTGFDYFSVSEYAQSHKQSWEILVTFGNSSSNVFTRALYTAKQFSYRFEEHNFEGSPIYQATFTAKPDSFLKFVHLYSLVRSWKSTAVFVNGEMVDSKTISSIISCYGEKCRTRDKRYCYGSRKFSSTENPFGCHCLGMNSSYNGWFNYNKHIGKFYWIDKSAIKDIIDQYSNIYHYCPCFDYGRIMVNLNKLPNFLSEKQMNDLNPYHYY